MIKSLYHTNIETAAQMVHVTDEFIKEWSSGKVDTMPSPEDGKPQQPGSLDDPEIFGDKKEKSLRMGHIELPIPAVNIHYLYGKNPILPSLLKMDRYDLDKITYFINYVVIEPNHSSLQYKQLLTEKEMNGLQDCDAEIKTGAEAISRLLEKEGVEIADQIILHSVPVIPLCFRWKYINEKEMAVYGIEILYESLLSRISRFNWLREIGAPKIIIRNESRCVQEYVDSLIDNGARGLPMISYSGDVLDSLNEMYKLITSLSGNKQAFHADDYSCELDEEKIRDLAIEYQNILTDDGQEMPYDEYEQKENDILERLYEQLLPLIENIIHKGFASYEKDFHEEMLQVGKDSLRKSLPIFAESDESALFFAKFLYKQINCYTKKRIMWN